MIQLTHLIAASCFVSALISGSAAAQNLVTIKLKGQAPFLGQNLGYAIDLAPNTLGIAPTYYSTFDGASWGPIWSLPFGCETIGCGVGIAAAENLLVTADAGDPGEGTPGLATAAWRDPVTGLWTQWGLSAPQFGALGVEATADRVYYGTEFGFAEYSFPGSGFVPTGGLLTLSGIETYRGGALEIDGDTILAGQDPYGRAVVLNRLGPLSYEHVATLAPDLVNPPPQAPGGPEFSSQMAIDGDWIAIGDYSADLSVHQDAGVVYLYERVNGMWTFNSRLSPPQIHNNRFFGCSVAMKDGRLLVGQIGSQGTLSADYGPAELYVLDRSRVPGQQWVLSEVFWPADTANYGNRFGAAVGLNWPWVAFGAPNDSELVPNSGAVYLYESTTAAIAADSSFCYGGQAASETCGRCPCGNDASSKTLGGCLNGEGRSATLSLAGSVSVAADDLKLGLRGAGSGSFALLVSGNQMLPGLGSVCPPGMGLSTTRFDGLACVGGGTRRHGVIATDANGHGVVMWGEGSGPGLVAQNGFVAGSSRPFQCVYRDVAAAGCGTGLNTTNAILASFLP